MRSGRCCNHCCLLGVSRGARRRGANGNSSTGSGGGHVRVVRGGTFRGSWSVAKRSMACAAVGSAPGPQRVGTAVHAGDRRHPSAPPGRRPCAHAPRPGFWPTRSTAPRATASICAVVHQKVTIGQLRDHAISPQSQRHIRLVTPSRPMLGSPRIASGRGPACGCGWVPHPHFGSAWFSLCVSASRTVGGSGRCRPWPATAAW